MKIDFLDAIKNVAASNNVNLTIYRRDEEKVPEFELNNTPFLAYRSRKMGIKIARP